MRNKSLENCRIGYASYSKDFSVPGDRRRFAAYAKHKGLTYEYADPSAEYDIVYVNYNSDSTKWVDYKKKRGDNCILIFEMIDSYLAEDYTLKSAMRGLMNYLSGRSSKLYADYRDGIIEICKAADAIVCSTEEQKKMMSAYNSNIHISLDIFAGDITHVKEDFRKHDKVRIVWEGQPHTLHNILQIEKVLNTLKDHVELHIVTDQQYYKYGNKYILKNTADLLKGIQCDKKFYPWRKDTFSEVITACDLSVIPIDMKEKLSLGKPENKLILLWQMGIPTLVSPTPAYERVLKKAGVDMLCYSLKDWEEKIMSYKNAGEEERRRISAKVKEFATTQYSAERLFQKWDAIFDSVLHR